MENIIVTITNEKQQYCYDIEVPTDLEIDKLTDDIVQTLNGYRPELYLNPYRIELFHQRTEKILESSRTMESSNVRNGDYILIRRKEY